MTSNKQPVHKKHKSAPEEMACPSRLFATGREELPVRRWRACERIRRGRAPTRQDARQGLRQHLANHPRRRLYSPQTLSMWCESFTKFSRLVGWVLGFATFCHLAGVDPLDAPPGLPSNADSLNSEPVALDFSPFPYESILADGPSGWVHVVWPFLSGETATSPRQETPLAIEGRPNPPGKFGNWSMVNLTALIVGEFKVILGRKAMSNFW